MRRAAAFVQKKKNYVGFTFYFIELRVTLLSHLQLLNFDFYVNHFDPGDFGVSFTNTVAGLYTRRGGPPLSVRGRPLIVPTRGPLYLPCKAAPQ